MSKISVIIVSYNERDYIETAINSVLSQNLGDNELELIIGDDGSNDGSIEYIRALEQNEDMKRQLGDHNFQFFIMNRPLNNDEIIPSIRASAVIKKALELATGNYVSILSADDSFCDKNKLRTASEYLDAHPSYIAYVTGYREAGLRHSNVVPKWEPPLIYWAGDYVHISCFTFRYIKPDHLLNRFCDDTGLEYTLSKLGKWKYDRTIAFEYVQRNGSIMNSATVLELHLLEGLIYQDTLNKGNSVWLKCATRSRMFQAIRNLFKKRNMLHDKAFSKYFYEASKYSNNIIVRIRDYNSTGIAGKAALRISLCRMRMDYYLFYCLRIIMRIIEHSCDIIGVKL